MILLLHETQQCIHTNLMFRRIPRLPDTILHQSSHHLHVSVMNIATYGPVPTFLNAN